MAKGISQDNVLDNGANLDNKNKVDQERKNVILHYKKYVQRD
jgi:hypothetical protein